MDKQRESFLFYRDWWNSLKNTPEIRHEVLDAIMAKVFDDKNPAVSPLAEMALSFILPVIERDTTKYQEKCDRNAENIRKRWNKKNTNVYERIQSNTNVGDNDNDNVNDNGNDNENVNDNELLLMSNDLLKEEEEEGRSEIKLESFVGIWNKTIDNTLLIAPSTQMQYITLSNLPDDAQKRLNKALRAIAKDLDDEAVKKICKENNVRPDLYSKGIAATWYIAKAIKKYSRVKMKFKDSSFGSFQWFINYPARIKKLYNGDIQ